MNAAFVRVLGAAVVLSVLGAALHASLAPWIGSPVALRGVFVVLGACMLGLQWIDGAPLAGRSVLDFGCGSGVLGIAAALCGASQVVAVDNDPQALLATAQNAERNGVADSVEVVAAGDWHERSSLGPSVDVVLANILAGPLVELAPKLLSVLRKEGEIVLSGILEHQALMVSSAYQSGCAMQPAVEQEGWVRLSGVRLAQ